MNVAYCIKLKQIALVDVFVIAVGFVLRILAGGSATYIWISQWNNDSVEDTYEHKNIEISIINDFIDRNNYQVIWENKIFQILLPHFL